jgi:hypothetical protein
LLGRIEHVHAGTTAHHTMGRTQLGAVDAETGAAMGALGDKTVGHAAIRAKRGASLLKLVQALLADR